MKKVLFVDARWVSQSGQGVATYFHEVYSRLEKNYKNDIEIIYGVLPGVLPNFIGTSSKIFEYKSDSFFWRLFILGFKINKLKPDFIHFQYTFPFWVNSKIVRLLTLHDLIFLKFPNFFPLKYRLIRKLLFRLSATRADKLITISEASRSDISLFFKIPPEKIDVIPLGVGSKLVSISPKKNDFLMGKKYILSVGRHEPRKNYERLIAAFLKTNLFESERLYLVIVGWIPQDFKINLNQYHSEGVIFITKCSDEELSWLYRNAHAFIFPSIAEGYGLPLVEALEFGIPSAVASTFPIDLAKKMCICVFDPFSIHEIEASIRTLYFQKKFFISGINGLPTWDDHVKIFSNLLMLGDAK